MKGILYSRRNCDGFKNTLVPSREDEIVVSVEEFRKYFPDTPVGGVLPGDGKFSRISIHLTQGTEGVLSWSAHVEHRSITHTLGHFKWYWDGQRFCEHWFDDTAVLLNKEEHSSGSGLTASFSGIVAYSCYPTPPVRVESFYQKSSPPLPNLGVIRAGFINLNSSSKDEHFPHPRGDATGFAWGFVHDGMCGGDSCHYGRRRPPYCGHFTPIIGDQLDVIIEAVLNGKAPVDATVCRHLASMKAYIVVGDEKSLPRYLCLACRLQGVRWDEFAQRNRADVCPYFRRAAKAVIDKSDPLPQWFQWSGDNLLSSYRRFSDGDDEAYEVSYVRRRDQFVRRAVLLVNNRTKESWMYPYSGFIPKTHAEFLAKFSNGKAITGVGGVTSHRDDDGLWTEEDFRKQLALTEHFPIWRNADGSVELLRFNDPRGGERCLDVFSLTKGNIQGFSFTPWKDPAEMGYRVEFKKDPTPFYVNRNGDRYYLVTILAGDLNGFTFETPSGEKISVGWKSHGSYFFLRMGKPLLHEVPLWEKEGHVLRELLAYIGGYWPSSRSICLRPPDWGHLSVREMKHISGADGSGIQVVFDTDYYLWVNTAQQELYEAIADMIISFGYGEKLQGFESNKARISGNQNHSIHGSC